MKVQPIPERLRNLGPKYHVCADLLESDERFRPAVAYAVGATVVCDTLEEAQDLCFRRGERAKVVTVRGHVIGRSGAMTGGAVGDRQTDRWQENEIEACLQRKNQLDDYLAQKLDVQERQRILDIDNKIQSLEANLQYSNVELQVLVEKHQQVVQLLSQLEASLLGKREQIAAMQLKMNEQLQSLEVVSREIEEIEQRTFQSFSRQFGVDNWRELEEKSVKQHQQIFKRLNEVHARRADLEANLEYERKKKFDVVLLRLQDQLKVVKQEQAAAIKSEDANKAEAANVLVEIKAMNLELASAKESQATMLSALKAKAVLRASQTKAREAVSIKLSLEEIGSCHFLLFLPQYPSFTSFTYLCVQALSVSAPCSTRCCSSRASRRSPCR